jgi:hypothetical protein
MLISIFGTWTLVKDIKMIISTLKKYIFFDAENNTFYIL